MPTVENVDPVSSLRKETDPICEVDREAKNDNLEKYAVINIRISILLPTVQIPDPGRNLILQTMYGTVTGLDLGRGGLH